MGFLDAVANWGPYAFVLPFLWIAVAYLVAAIRARRTQPQRESVSLAAPLWSVLFWSVLLIFMSNSARRSDDPSWMLIWYGYFVLFSLLTINKLKPNTKSIQPWQKFGFASLQDFLLFRPIPDAQPMSDFSNTANAGPSENRAIIWLALIVSICAAGLSYLGDSLQTCRWLDMATGRSGCLRSIPLPNGAAYEIALSPDGRVMAMSGRQEPLRVYNVADGTLLRELPIKHTVCGQGVSFSPNNQWLATISNAGEVSISDVQAGTPIHTLEIVTNTLGVKFSPDGKYLAVNNAESGLHLWRTSDWKLQWVIAAQIYSIRFSADGRWLAAKTPDDRVGIWQMADGTVYRTIDVPVYHWALSPDGSQLATADLFGPIKVWGVSSGQLTRIIDAETRGEISYSFDGQHLLADEDHSAVFSSVDQVGVWRVADGRQVAAFPSYFWINCAASATKSNVFAYSDWKALRVFRLRQD